MGSRSIVSPINLVPLIIQSENVKHQIIGNLVGNTIETFKINSIARHRQMGTIPNK